MLTFLGSQRIHRHWIITVRPLDRRITADGIRLCLRIGLIEIEIHITTRCHDHVVSHAGGLDSPFLAPPRHDGSLRSQAPFLNLIPTDQFAAFGNQEFLGTMNHIALQLIHVLHPIPAHQALTFRAGLPSSLPGLVSPDMDIFGREQLDHLGQYILHERKRFLVADAEITRRIRFAGTTQLRVRHEHLVRMPREFDFRYYINMPGRSVIHDLTDIFFRKIAAICPRSSFRQILTILSIPPFLPIRFRTESHVRSQFRIFIHLDTPTTGIRQMHMKRIQFIIRHDVQ